jgi:uncharacterized protein
MRILINTLLFLSVVFLIDLYVYYGLKTATVNSSARLKTIITYLYWGAALAFYALVIYLVSRYDGTQGPTGKLFKLMAGSFVLLYVPKLFFTFFLLAEDAYRMLRGLIAGGSNLISTGSNISLWESRRQFISQTGAAVAAIPFAGIVYGIIKGRYNFKVKHVELSFSDLPEAFNGFTITQISDIHSGSWDNKEELERAVALINKQESNVVFFTGDLVNNRAAEMVPWIDTLKKISAKEGKYSILGNHDYGDYTQWESGQVKNRNFDHLKQIHQQIGFRLMLNETLRIERNNEFVDLIGMENWGAGGFSKYGNLPKAMQGTSEKSFRILLSHDPSHWESEVMNHSAEHIHLTLSGHTHGMQFGVELGDFKISPVKLRYPRWAGLYKENNRFLYVNRGLGFIGFPGRVGIWPEITVIKLVKA